jgi:hypothetical protein
MENLEGVTTNLKRVDILAGIQTVVFFSNGRDVM